MSEDSTLFNIEEFLSSAKEAKRGIYSDRPQVTPQQLAREVKAAEAEFSQVVDEEIMRIKVFADEENDRILELRGQNGAEESCPICLEVLPIILMEGEEVGHMTCCGVRCHQKCFATWNRRRGPTISSACFHCRSTANIDSSDRGWMKHWENLTVTGSTVSKANALKELAGIHENGKYGKKKNVNKALKYYERAAELGNSDAQSKIAAMSHYGEFHGKKIPKSPERVMDMAQRAVDQGNAQAQALLGYCLNEQHESGEGDFTEADRLFAISAYQGDICGIVEREEFYAKKFENRSGRYRSVHDIRRVALLRLYWSGRLCNKKENEDSRINFNPYIHRFITHFQTANIMLWHRRPCFELDPLTGHSHIPLITSIYSVLQEDWHDHEYTNDAHGELLKNSVWKQICANCGKQRDEKCVLKQCSRCQVFSYCSKECQVKHWKAGHKVDCKGRHWIESYFPNIRKP